MKKRNERLQRTGRKQRANRRGMRTVQPRTLEEFLALSERDQDRWIRTAHAVSKMRSERLSLQKASREFGLDPRTVMRRGGSALRKRGRRYEPKRNDRLLRPLVIPTPQGNSLIGVRDYRQAVLLADYWNAVQRYLETGDASALKRFQGKHVTDAVGKQVQLITDLDELNRLGNAGSLSFESLYARSA
jgi:hypothetical protein